MPDAFARLIRKLQDEGRVPRSQFSARSLKELRSLFDAGVLDQERSGSGLVVTLKKPDVLQSFYLSRYPNAGKVVYGSPRASAVATFRNAKRTRRSDMEPVLLRAMSSIICMRDKDEYDLLATTRLAGAACLLLEPEHFWSFSADVAIVENLECFLHFEQMSISADVVLYAAGRLSDLALQWIASESLSACRFIHCGDYDPVGLDEFLRLHNLIGERVTLHIPANLKDLVSKYGRPELIGDSTAVLRRLRGTSSPAVIEVMSILDDTGCGLEQEILLVQEEER